MHGYCGAGEESTIQRGYASVGEQDPRTRTQDTDSKWYCTHGFGRIYGLPDSVRRQALAWMMGSLKQRGPGTMRHPRPPTKHELSADSAPFSLPPNNRMHPRMHTRTHSRTHTERHTHTQTHKSRWVRKAVSFPPEAGLGGKRPSDLFST